MKIVFFTIIFFYGFFEKNLARAILGGTMESFWTQK